MLLEANFDIEQVGGTLEWHFSRKDRDGNPITGKYAGGIYYTVGEEMRVRVRAGSYKRLKSFKVLDCTLITLPQIVEIAPKKKAQFAAVSPFVGTEGIVIAGGSVNLAAQDFKESAILVPQPEYYELALEWDKHLTVGQKEGRWDISFVLTVEVVVDDGSQYGLTCTRVYSFDPEGEVGTGTTPPR
jgi:hypothetical protein